MKIDYNLLVIISYLIIIGMIHFIMNVFIVASNGFFSVYDEILIIVLFTGVILRYLK